MSTKILFAECMGKHVTAIYQNERIQELRYFPLHPSTDCQVGDIYIGKVKKILPKINAAFIEIGNHTECYYPLEEVEYTTFTKKPGKKPIAAGDELLVQIKKEASKAKQPTVTGNLNLTGKYVVLTSGNKKTGISSKLDPASRQRLVDFSSAMEPCEFGIVFRTNAGDADFEVIQAEIRQLNDLFTRLLTIAPTRTCYTRLYATPNPALLILRDIYHSSLDEIIVDAGVEDGRLYEEAKDYISAYQPEYLPLLRAYNDKDYPLSKCYSMEHITSEALSEKIWMKSGGFLVIQPTEALTVIDVNSGKCLMKNKNSFDINKEAAVEIAHQIRLRNLSGIIIVDFINMKDKETCSELLSFLQKELYKDPNPGKVIEMTKLQLVEITRRKTHKTLAESVR